MSKIITIDPVTRISGFLEITAEVDGSQVVNASTSGVLFRGFEKMLRGRHPLDAIYFTERICGICSTAHAIASTLALEDALKVKPAINDLYIRDIAHGFEFLQNHLRQFYLYTMPSYANLPDIKPVSPQNPGDLRLPPGLDKKISNDYMKAITYSRLAHEGLAVIGGKVPHTHGIFVGGVTVNMDSQKLSKIKSIISAIYQFVSNNMVEDMDIPSRYYADYFEKGVSYPNFLSYGLYCCYDDPGLTYVKPGVMVEGERYTFSPNKITEAIHYSWYRDEQPIQKPGEEKTVNIDLSKKWAYSFIKAPRYEGRPMQVGPLARLKLSGEYNGGYSTMDRNIARVLETKKIAEIMERLAERVEPIPNSQRVYDIPMEALGTGLTDTTRGALGHWLEIEDKVIKYYDVITPTAWNLSPMDGNGIHGPAEEALIGSNIDNTEEPIELGRIVRSFDPCISCATHLTGRNQKMLKAVMV